MNPASNQGYDENAWKRIRAFAFDVDGVLTDGGILAHSSGELFRTFDSKDGFAFRMASMHGYHLAIITGGRAESIRKRFLRHAEWGSVRPMPWKRPLKRRITWPLVQEVKDWPAVS